MDATMQTTTLIPGPVVPIPALGITPVKAMTRKKILVVDDNVVIQKMLSMKLKISGYDVLIAADGGTAVSTVRTQKPDLVLLDISFPPDVAHGGGVAWDGFLIMDWLRRIDGAAHIPIIVITGGDPDKLKARSLAAGAVAFFHKPIDNSELLAAIRHALGEDSTPAASAPAPQ